MLHAMNTLSMACMLEPILWLLALLSYSRLTWKADILWFRLYLATQMAVSALSVPLLLLVSRSRGALTHDLLLAYLQFYWWGSIVAGIFAIATLRSILKRLLGALVGLQRVALVTFQWLLVIAFFIILDRMLAHSTHTTLDQQLAIVSYGISVFELVLLLLQVPFTFILRRSLRSHFQDLMMGLAILAISNSILGIAFHANGTFSSGAAAAAGHVIVVTTLIFWVSCFVAQQKMEPPRMLPMDSKLVQWSERLRVLDRASTDRGR